MPVPENLATPHRLIAAFIESDREDAELAKRRGWPFQSRSESELDKRMLRILSGLYEAIEKRGHRLEYPKDAVWPVGFVVNGEPISFRLFEYVRRMQVPLTPRELKNSLNVANGRTTKMIRKPTSQLVLLAESDFQSKKRRWSDSGRRLEDQLGAIILEFEEMAEQAAIKRAKWEEEDRQFQAKIARQDELRARQQRVAADWKQIRGFAADWSEAQRLRMFIGAVETRLLPLPDSEGHGRSWLDWARAEVEGLDPMGTGAITTLSELLKGRGFHRWRDATDDEDDEY